jgi:hypothetical protein
MTDEIDAPDVVAEVEAAFTAYNAALDAGDSTALNGFFWHDPHTVRFGVTEHLFGYDQISAFRSGVWTGSGGARQLDRLAVTTIGRDFATTMAVFSRPGQPTLSRQSQTWARRPEGWRIIAAHVSNLTPK